MLIFFGVNNLLCKDGDAADQTGLKSLKTLNKAGFKLVCISYMQFFPRSRQWLERIFKTNNIDVSYLMDHIKGCENCSLDKLEICSKKLDENDWVVVYDTDKYSKSKNNLTINGLTKPNIKKILRRFKIEA